MMVVTRRRRRRRRYFHCGDFSTILVVATILIIIFVVVSGSSSSSSFAFLPVCWLRNNNQYHNNKIRQQQQQQYYTTRKSTLPSFINNIQRKNHIRLNERIISYSEKNDENDNDKKDDESSSDNDNNNNMMQGIQCNEVMQQPVHGYRNKWGRRNGGMMNDDKDNNNQKSIDLSDHFERELNDLTDFSSSDNDKSTSSSSSRDNNDKSIEEVYKEWCAEHGKQYNSSRLEIFESNYNDIQQYVKRTGKPVKLNKNADLTIEEYTKLQTPSQYLSRLGDTRFVKTTTSNPTHKNDNGLGGATTKVGVEEEKPDQKEDDALKAKKEQQENTAAAILRETVDDDSGPKTTLPKQPPTQSTTTTTTTTKINHPKHDDSFFYSKYFQERAKEGAKRIEEEQDQINQAKLEAEQVAIDKQTYFDRIRAEDEERRRLRRAQQQQEREERLEAVQANAQEEEEKEEKAKQKQKQEQQQNKVSSTTAEDIERELNEHVRTAYISYCKFYNNEFTESRLPIFKEKLIKMNLDNANNNSKHSNSAAAGSSSGNINNINNKIDLDEFADLTDEECNALKEEKKDNNKLKTETNVTPVKEEPITSHDIAEEEGLKNDDQFAAQNAEINKQEKPDVHVKETGVLATNDEDKIEPKEIDRPDTKDHDEMTNDTTAASTTKTITDDDLIRSNAKAYAKEKATEAERVHIAYSKWCQEYGKEFDEKRLANFATNWSKVQKFQKDTGKTLELNQYSDLSKEEYNAIQTSDWVLPLRPTDSRNPKSSSPYEVKKIYNQWCEYYGKTPSNWRFPNFLSNYLRVEHHYQTTGVALDLDENADKSTEERVLEEEQQMKKSGIDTDSSDDDDGGGQAEIKEVDRVRAEAESKIEELQAKLKAAEEESRRKFEEVENEVKRLAEEKEKLRSEEEPRIKADESLEGAKRIAKKEKVDLKEGPFQTGDTADLIKITLAEVEELRKAQLLLEEERLALENAKKRVHNEITKIESDVARSKSKQISQSPQWMAEEEEESGRFIYNQKEDWIDTVLSVFGTKPVDDPGRGTISIKRKKSPFNFFVTPDPVSSGKKSKENNRLDDETRRKIRERKERVRKQRAYKLAAERAGALDEASAKEAAKVKRATDARKQDQSIWSWFGNDEGTRPTLDLEQTDDEGSLSQRSSQKLKDGRPPTLLMWSENRDGSITGIVSNSVEYKSGTRITTSPLQSQPRPGATVTTESGSQYHLGQRRGTK